MLFRSNDLIRFAFGTGNGGFNGMVDVAPPIGFFRTTGRTVVSDWNNDGFDDYALGGTSIQILAGNNTNNPQITFTSPADTNTTGNVLYSFDMDGDGYEDILANANGSNFQHFAIYRNNAVGGFDDVEYFGFWLFDSDPTTPSIYRVYNYMANDFNGDGRTDVVAYIRDRKSVV